MKHRNWLAIGASILLCAALFAPQSLEAASKHASKASKTTSISKKASKKSVKTAKAASTRKSRKTESAKAAKTDQRKASAAKKDASDRDVWLKRAQFSEAMTGKASWYGKDFHNKATASGLTYDMHTFTAAHRTLPIGTVVKVTDQKNGKSVMVCVTDRGPFVRDRIIDVSYAAAHRLGLQKKGVGHVRLEVVSDEHGAPLKKDQAYFVKYPSQSGKNTVGPFNAFADAAAMREALEQAHPDAEVILDKAGK